MLRPQSPCCSKTLFRLPNQHLPHPSLRPPTCKSLLRLPLSRLLSPEASSLPLPVTLCLEAQAVCAPGLGCMRVGTGTDMFGVAPSGLWEVPHLVCVHHGWIQPTHQLHKGHVWMGTSPLCPERRAGPSLAPTHLGLT